MYLPVYLLLNIRISLPIFLYVHIGYVYIMYGYVSTYLHAFFPTHLFTYLLTSLHVNVPT